MLRKLTDLSHAELVKHATWLKRELEKADDQRILVDRLRGEIAELKRENKRLRREAAEASRKARRAV